jgi:uncharacterized membrane protein (DUF485 family)
MCLAVFVVIFAKNRRVLSESFDDIGHFHAALTQREQVMYFVTIVSLVISSTSIFLIVFSNIYIYTYEWLCGPLTVENALMMCIVIIMMAFALIIQLWVENRHTILEFMRKLNQVEDWNKSTDVVAREFFRFFDVRSQQQQAFVFVRRQQQQ